MEQANVNLESFCNTVSLMYVQNSMPKFVQGGPKTNSLNYMYLSFFTLEDTAAQMFTLEYGSIDTKTPSRYYYGMDRLAFFDNNNNGSGDILFGAFSRIQEEKDLSNPDSGNRRYAFRLELSTVS